MHPLQEGLLAFGESGSGQAFSRDEALARIAEQALRLLEVDQVAIWLYDSTCNQYCCVHPRSGPPTPERKRIAAGECSALCAQLERHRVVTVSDVHTHPATAALAKTGRAPETVSSVMLTPIHLGAQRVGCLCYEHTGAPREWTDAEVQTAASVADIVALAIRAADQDRSERQLRETLAELQQQKQVLDRHAIVSASDPGGRITYVNEKFCEVSGYTAEELIGQDHRILNSGRHPPGFFQDLWQTLSRGKTWQGEICNRAKGGRLYWLESTIVPFIDSGGRIDRYLSIHTEITPIMAAEQTLRDANERLDQLVQEKMSELQQAQNQLLQSEKMASIGQLAAGVAHEINNPVGYITSNLGSLQTYIDDLIHLLRQYAELETAVAADHPKRQQIEAVKRRVDVDYLLADIQDLVRESQEGVGRVKRIVQDLKDFSRSSGMDWETADLHVTLESTLNIVHNELKYKADVIREFGDLPPLECVPTQLGQVFINLLVNAADAIEQHGTITVRTGTDDGWGWVQVEDTGRGIEPEALPRVFEPFFTTKPMGRGTGLGLSVSYGIVEKHGGRIEVESRPGNGSRFTIWLPQKQPRRKP